MPLFFIAAYASELFFCVADLATIDPMYQYSLSYFISLFLRSIEASEHTKDVTANLASLRKHFTYFLFTNICRSLFEAHKLLFAFLLAVKIALSRREIDASHLAFLLTGGTGAVDAAAPNPADGIFSAKAWGEVSRLSLLGGSFAGLAEGITQDIVSWATCVLRM
jgi:dynein heavy chain, axonemal